LSYRKSGGLSRPKRLYRVLRLRQSPLDTEP
jgi:hypothetical protein